MVKISLVAIATILAVASALPSWTDAPARNALAIRGPVPVNAGVIARTTSGDCGTSGQWNNWGTNCGGSKSGKSHKSGKSSKSSKSGKSSKTSKSGKSSKTSKAHNSGWKKY
ncbi:hypothetical protein LTR05_008665 [Lithohypha guttulata]|uniref:Uncharacterized protein n=1 Tax=Lithohypha guttulata TaxID=1690604 RepID=A0AAN7SLC1_9EURO|nr:hypothetical protein LTR05_008665 [Lithohypha guttulata]